MLILTDDFLRQLSSYLQSLPSVGKGQDRDLSWRDTVQILAHWKVQGWNPPTSDPDTLDKALLALLGERTGAFPIRFAKYPGRTSIRRLWGHTDRVGTGPATDARLSIDRPHVFEEIDLPLDAPQVFLSHSHGDLHFTSRVRLEIGRAGLRAWMSELELREGELIVEGIRSGIQQSVAVIGLLTRRSLTAAWFDTEVYGGPAVVPNQEFILACDSTDDDLLFVLSHWSPGIQSLPPECNRAIVAMKESLRHELSPARYDKYDESAASLLVWLSSWTSTKTIYPRRPSDWQGSPAFLDFSDLIKDRAGRWLKGLS